MIPFERRPWHDEQRDYLNKNEEIEAAAWCGVGVVLAILVALAHEVWTRFVS